MIAPRWDLFFHLCYTDSWDAYRESAASGLRHRGQHSAAFHLLLILTRVFMFVLLTVSLSYMAIHVTL